MKRDGISALRKMVVTTAEQSKEDRKVVLEKRAKRGRKDSQDCKNKGVPNFDGCGEKSLSDIETKLDKINWFAVQLWFHDAIKRNNESWLAGAGDYDVNNDNLETHQVWWGWREKNPAQRLLKTYGPELTKKAVDWLCDNWQVMKDRSNGKLTGAPTVNFLWVMREQIIPDVIEGKRLIHKRKKKHMVGEYDASKASKAPKVGWGDA